jgi:hypothetical protein
MSSTSKVTGKHRAAAVTGAAIGRDASGDLRQIIHTARARCAGDPTAIAAMATVILHALVDNGRSGSGLTGDSLAAALQGDRHRAIRSLGLGPTDVSEVLPGVGRVRAAQLLTAADRAYGTNRKAAWGVRPTGDPTSR